MKSKVIYLFVITTLIFFYSCKDDNPTESGDGVQTIEIQHFGVDFSTGKTGETMTQNDSPDGETVAWCPNGQGGGYGSGIWFRPVTGNMYRVGNGNLGDVSSVDDAMWSNDVCDTPLANGDVWVSEVADGYVVFKVVEVASDSAAIAADPMWKAKVEYKYSENKNF